MSTSIDQQRAAYAWQCASKRRGIERYCELTEGASALVMGSGLMAALAFWRSRKKEAADALLEDLLGWFAKGQQPLAKFDTAIERMVKASPRQYMELTDEALSLLRWLRQFAKALKEG